MRAGLLLLALAGCAGQPASPPAPEPTRTLDLAVVVDGCAWYSTASDRSGYSLAHSETAGSELAQLAALELERRQRRTLRMVQPFVCAAAPTNAPARRKAPIATPGEARRDGSLPLPLHASIKADAALASAYRRLLVLPPACGQSMAFPLTPAEAQLLRARLGTAQVLALSVQGRVDSPDRAAANGAAAVAAEVALLIATGGASAMLLGAGALGPATALSPGSRYHAVLHRLDQNQSRALSCGAGKAVDGQPTDRYRDSPDWWRQLLAPLFNTDKVPLAKPSSPAPPPVSPKP